MTVSVEAFFLEPSGLQAQRRYCLLRQPGGRPPSALVVYVHPLAEEMNKSRRMATLQAQALAEAGFAVLQLDLSGCGDSSGDFGDASWQGWVADVVDGAHWLQTRWPGLPLWVWGLRAGALVAHEAAELIDAPIHRLYWQPAHDGSLVLQHFLRLRVVGSLLDSQPRTSVTALKTELTRHGGLEIGGYLIRPALADGLEAARLRPPGKTARVVWLEVAQAPGARLSPMSATALEAWRQAGHRVDAAVVEGPSFWQTAEVEEAPALIAATTALLAESLP